MSSEPETTRSNAVPRHVAIIMDGNGRWAKARGLQRLEGHRQGVETVRTVVRAARDAGIGYLTLYSFSTENWKRPEAEVFGLMQIFRTFFRRNLNELHKDNARIRVIGQSDRLENDILELIDKAVEKTRGNTGLGLTLAFNYGSRAEIVEACNAAIAAAHAGELDPSNITAEDIAKRLSTKDIPDPDFVLRTSGEQRLSNYLMWQTVNAPLLFTNVSWPDFARKDLDAAVAEWQSLSR